MSAGRLPKYYRTQIADDHTSTCPWCGQKNDHIRTATLCPHVAKVSSKGIVFYYWGFRPDGWKGHQDRDKQIQQALHILGTWVQKQSARWDRLSNDADQ